jgi:hypothetical protein
MPADLALPPGSSIPAGIYNGNIAIDVTIHAGSDMNSESSSPPFTVVIDENGRLLDSKGSPFVIGQLYHLDAGQLQLDALSQSIAVSGTQILLRFAVTAAVDLGQVHGTFTGSQTDTVSFDANSGEMHFVRSQIYGGVGSDGTPVTFITKGDAILRPG